MISPLRVFLILFAMLQIAAADDTLTRPQPGQWAAGGTYLWPGPTAIADLPRGGRQLRVLSPDKRMELWIDGSEGHVVRGSDRRSEVIPVQSLAEVLWAPDSTAFALTESDGGSVGNWSVSIYNVATPSIARLAVADTAVRADYRQHVMKRACPGEEPNVAAVSWMHGSEQLALVAEVPPHSSCREMGGVYGYVVGLPGGKIVRRLNDAEVRRAWSTDLGLRLQSRGHEG
jgi:hypothetical protein